MEKQNKSTGKTVLIALLLIVTIVSLVLATYAWAKYTSNGDGTATAQVAKWNVKVSTDTTKFQQTYTHVLDERIAPGTKGQLDATVAVGTDTEVDVDYKIYIEDVKVEYVGEARKDESGAEVPATIPANMKFFDSENQPIAHSALKAGTEIASGRVEYGVGKSDVTTALTWEWPYETGDKLEGSSDLNTGDAQDTLDGQYPVKITIKYKVDAWQVEPEGPNA